MEKKREKRRQKREKKEKEWKKAMAGKRIHFQS